jgi:hypothetical protein
MLRFQDDRGRPIKGWQKRFDKFMRCHQTGTVHRMDPRLAHMLYQTARHYEGHRMEVVSGYRHPSVARNPKSPHKQGLACDFRMAWHSQCTTLRDWVRKTFDHAGVGYYPNSVFVHLDNRKKDPVGVLDRLFAGPGQVASYAENPREDLRSGRAERRQAKGEEAAGRAEGEDDNAQAGSAISGNKLRVNGGRGNAATKGSGSVEIKNIPDPFGD